MGCSKAITKTQAAIAIIIIIAVIALGYYSTLPAPPTAPPTPTPTATPTVTPAPPKKVYLLFAHSLSGAYAKYGEHELRGVKMAIENINKMGGIKALGGATMELWKIVDLTSDPKTGAAAFEAALAEAKAAGITISAVTVMDISAMTGPCIPIADKYRIPLLASVGTTSFSQMGYKYFFRIFPTNEYWAKGQIDFVKLVVEQYKPEYKTIAWAYQDTAWPTDLTKSGKEWFQKYGLDKRLKIVAEVAYPKELVDPVPVATKLKEAGADILILIGYDEVLMILKAMKAIGYKPLIIGGGGAFAYPEFLDTMGPDAEGITVGFSCNHNWNNPIFKEVNAKYKALYGSFIHEHAISGYSGPWIVKYAIEVAKSADPEKVREGLLKLDIVMGPLEDEGKINEKGQIISPHSLAVFCSGRLKFKENGDNEYMTGIIVQWQSGELVTVYPEYCTPYRLKPPK
ncbi:MAG: ABC transporter substrate-binding protein [Thermoproteota archaeon]